MNRYGTALPVATLVTAALLALMTGLIHESNAETGETNVRVRLSASTYVTPPPLAPKTESLPPQPPRPVVPPETAIAVDWTFAPIATPLSPAPPHPVALPITELTALDQAQAPTDAPAIALTNIAPEYPGTLLARGIEGYVDVRFDVTEMGSVTNIEIVFSSHSGFERAAIKAAEKMRYQPRVVDGQNVSTIGLERRFRFSLERSF